MRSWISSKGRMDRCVQGARGLRRGGAALVASVACVFAVGQAGAEELATYVFETTEAGAGQHCQARVEFSFYRRAGDRELTADEIVDGYAVFSDDRGVVAAIDLAYDLADDDAGFGPIGIAPDGSLRIDGLRSTATVGTLRIPGDPSITLGPGGGRIGLDRRTGCTFYGVWSASVDWRDEPVLLADHPEHAEHASARGVAILGGLAAMGAIGHHRRWRARRSWQS